MQTDPGNLIFFWLNACSSVHFSVFCYTYRNVLHGEMTERPKVHDWKSCVPVRVPRVQIPISPKPYISGVVII